MEQALVCGDLNKSADLIQIVLVSSTIRMYTAQYIEVVSPNT